jgi:hypothetical protein
MEFKGTKGKINVANAPDGMTHKTTEGFYELYTSPYGIGIVGYAKEKADAILFSKAPEMLEMLKELINLHDLGHEIGQYDKARQLIKEATEL